MCVILLCCQQKTAYEVGISDWSSDVCSSDLQLGCVATTARFFGDGKLTRRGWKEAMLEVGAQFQQFAGIYRHVGWQETLGASGTIKAVGDICARWEERRAGKEYGGTCGSRWSQYH